MEYHGFGGIESPWIIDSHPLAECHHIKMEVAVAAPGNIRHVLDVLSFALFVKQRFILKTGDLRLTIDHQCGLAVDLAEDETMDSKEAQVDR